MIITQKTQASQSRCKPIKTPVWHGCPSLCPSVCGVHSVSRVHLSILNPLQRRSQTRSNSLPGDHLWPLITTQNADFTPCCIRRVTRRAPEGLHCIFRNARFQNQRLKTHARKSSFFIQPWVKKEPPSDLTQTPVPHYLLFLLIEHDVRDSAHLLHKASGDECRQSAARWVGENDPGNARVTENYRTALVFRGNSRPHSRALE